MKKLLIGLVMLGMLFSAEYVEQHYTKKAIVNNIENDILTFEDARGHLWECQGNEKNLKINQLVELTFDDNNTKNTLTDDKIVRVKIVK